MSATDAAMRGLFISTVNSAIAFVETPCAFTYGKHGTDRGNVLYGFIHLGKLVLDASWPGKCGADFQLALAIFATFAAL